MNGGYGIGTVPVPIIEEEFVTGTGDMGEELGGEGVYVGYDAGVYVG